MSHSASVIASLAHLKRIKPTDGWDVQKKPGSARLVRLSRRGAPVTDNYFFDIHLCGGQVVGILTTSGPIVQAQVLVDRSGKLIGTKRASLVQVSDYDPNKSAAASAAASTASRSSTRGSTSSSSSAAASSANTLTDAQNKDLLLYGGALFGAMIAMRIVMSTVATFVLLLPALFAYSLYTCPSIESFDAKRELKRILRGHYLADDHPDKPKGMLSEAFARITATVTTELATLPGYEVTIIPMAGVFYIASARVPSVEMDYYWIGVWNRWYYVYAAPLSTTTTG